MVEACRAECRGQNLNQAVILTILVLEQSPVSLLGQHIGGGTRCVGNLPQITAGSLKDRNHAATAVVTAVEDRIGQRHEAPEKVQCFSCIDFRYLSDGLSLGLEIRNKGFALVPIDEGAGAGNGGQALADRLCHVGRTGGTDQFQPQAALGCCIAPADLNQQFCQALGSKRFEVLRVQSLP